MWINDDDRASWAFVEGSISVSASILLAYAISVCDGCHNLPVIGFFKELTELDSGVLIAGMALLFPTALGFFVGAKMVFGAYRSYRRWRDEQLARLEAANEAARAEGRAESQAEALAEGIDLGQQMGRESERERIRQMLEQQGLLTPETERILSNRSDSSEPDDEA